MTYEPQDIEAVRAYWASYQKLEEEGLVVGTALEDNREDQALGAAWRRAEAALPEGFTFSVGKTAGVGSGPYVAVTDFGEPAEGYAYGPTPTAALEALAAYIVALVNAAPALLSRIEALETALREIVGLCDLSIDDMRIIHGSEQRVLMAVIPARADRALLGGPR